jgi:O-antigen/teichoic acid export membrane protein
MSEWRDKAIGLVGLGVSGAAAYLFLVIAGRSLGAGPFASVGALWAVVFLATAAIAAPLEIVVARDVAAARGRGDPLRSLLRAGFVLAGIAGIVAIGAVLLAGGWLDRALFGGQVGFSLVGAVAFAGLVVGAVAKGACAGGNRLAGWGAYLVVDGGVRLGLSIFAVMCGAQSDAFAVAIAVGPWVALVALALQLRSFPDSVERDVHPGLGVAALAKSTVPLVVAASAAAALTYLGAVMLPVLVGAPTAAVGAYIAALALARLPLFALSPFVAIVVPRIAFAIETGDVTVARQIAVVFMGIAAVSGLAVVVVAFSVGSGPLVSMFGAGFALPAGSVRAIGIAAACWLFATAATSVAVAAGHGHVSAMAWSAGLVGALAAAAASGPDPFDRTNAAVTIGALVAGVAAGFWAVVALRGRLVAGGVQS